jgi:hypothetical protein
VLTNNRRADVMLLQRSIVITITEQKVLKRCTHIHALSCLRSCYLAARIAGLSSKTNLDVIRGYSEKIVNLLQRASSRTFPSWNVVARSPPFVATTHSPTSHIEH